MEMLFAAALPVIAVVAGRAVVARQPIVRLNEHMFQDRVFACWLGKNVGGTLGMPFEGRRETNSVTFYTDLKPGEPAPNDDLDLQLLWLKAMQDRGGAVDARTLGEYWLKHVPVDWNEYGIGKANMRLGLLPPLSGEFRNAQWKHSNGAWIRTEIWACLAPGSPVEAAKMAREDACVDHGAAEGTLAAIFVAAVESAAFVEKRPSKLLEIGLSMIPERCEVAQAVRTVMASHEAGKDWLEAREAVLEVTKATGWFQAPRNVAFVVIGWLYGSDFGDSICKAVNCGDDTDCTGATLGSLLGILGGTAAIPAKWSEPIGTRIVTVAISGFDNVANLRDLTEQTVSMAKRVGVARKLPVAIGPESTDLTGAGELKLIDRKAAAALAGLSPYRIVWRERGFEAVLDYLADPLVKPGVLRNLKVAAPKGASCEVVGLPAGWSGTVTPAGAGRFTVSIAPPTSLPDHVRFDVEIRTRERTVRIPVALFSSP